MQGCRLTIDRVLVLQDEPNSEFAAALVEFLRQQGCAVSGVGGRDDLVEKVLRTRPDVILLHGMTAHFDAGDLCARLKGFSQMAAVPVIVVTPGAGADLRVKSLVAGAADHIQTPFDWMELWLRMVIHHRRRQMHDFASLARS